MTHHRSFLKARVTVVPEVSDTQGQGQHEEERTTSIFLADVESEVTNGEGRDGERVVRSGEVQSLMTQYCGVKTGEGTVTAKLTRAVSLWRRAAR